MLMMTMEISRRWPCFFIWVMSCFSLLSFGRGHGYDPQSLDVFVNHQARKAMAMPYTGRLYTVNLPANYSTMEVSVVRLRSASLWARGANFTSFYIPPRTLTIPFEKRIAIVYQNLGNWSSYYYKVPGFYMVAPVVGFMAYDASNLSSLGDHKLNFSIFGDPISVRFPHVQLPKDRIPTMKCVAFGDDGTVEFSNMTHPEVCSSQRPGHFSVVIPEKKERLWKWWAVGFAGGFAVLVMGVVSLLAIVKIVKKRKLKEKERTSENSEAVNSIQIGTSKMPRAAVIRTQPVLEMEHFEPVP